MNMSSIARACVVLLILVGLGFGSVGCTKQPPPPGTCDACGTINDLAARFCAGCGASLVEPCPGCSAEIRVGVRFCPECGDDVEAIRTERAPFLAAGGVVIDLGSGVELRLVEIKPGRFMMGSPTSELNRVDLETLHVETQHEVTITRAFWLGQTEVTQAQWQAVMGSNPSYFEGDLNRPVEQVSWNDAQEFCRRLSQKTGMTFRLPTEAEWEYACRAGTQTAYSFGDDPSDLREYAWFGSNSGREPFDADAMLEAAMAAGDGSAYDSRLKSNENATRPVGTRKPNPWGLHDMHGNVAEWVEDWLSGTYYSESPPADPPGPTSGTRRVLRGGSWSDHSGLCRAAGRYGSDPGYDGLNFVGFRVARTP